MGKKSHVGKNVTRKKNNSSQSGGKSPKQSRIRKTGKVSKRNTSKKASTRVRIAADTKYWANRKRRTKNAANAKYSRKSLQSPRAGTSFVIKKKMKDLPYLPVNKETLNLIVEQLKKYLRVTDKTRKKQQVFIKVNCYVEILQGKEMGELYFFVSAPRQTVQNTDDIFGILEKIFSDIESEYMAETEITGYECEVTISKEKRARKKLQRSHTTKKRRKKKT